MKKASLSVLSIFVVLSTLALFQNCAEPLPRNAVLYELESGSGGSMPPPSPGPLPTMPSQPNWVAGDPFNYADLPSTMQSQMVSTQLTELGYAGYSGPKAVAISATGLGFVRRALPGVTQAQVEKMALDSCFAVTGGQSCAVIATGNMWKMSRNNLNNSFTYTLSAPTGISASTIPFLAPADAAAAAAAYNNAPSPKALAISLDGLYMWIGQSTTDPIANLAEARRLVLERCELSAGAIPCVIFAENGSPVLNPSAINRQNAIDYARTSVQANIPGLRQTPYVQVIQNNYLVNGGAALGAIYISANGRAGAYYGSVDVDVLARNTCNGTVNNGFPCFKYATNATINSLIPNLVSRKTYGQNMHCKVVPRLNCAAHLALGCPAGGQYYVVGPGPVVQLTTCN